MVAAVWNQGRVHDGLPGMVSALSCDIMSRVMYMPQVLV